MKHIRLQEQTSHVLHTTPLPASHRTTEKTSWYRNDTVEDFTTQKPKNETEAEAEAPKPMTKPTPKLKPKPTKPREPKCEARPKQGPRPSPSIAFDVFSILAVYLFLTGARGVGAGSSGAGDLGAGGLGTALTQETTRL